ncbi:MAG TPA: oligosaccharide flippase family protein, partial [Candidatus Kapabacteria bacterium]|nr:oligosaccharide flippase family protein [Candidatus Kapabacteria bacterium]
RREVVTYTFLAHALYMALASLLVFSLRWQLASLLQEPRYVDVLTAMPILCLLTIPRTYGLKFFQMLIKTREIFLIDLAFFGTMAIETMYRIHAHALNIADDLITINIHGAIVASLIAVLLALPYARFRLRIGKDLLRTMASFGFYQGSAVLTYLLQQQADVIIVKYFSSEIQVANYNSAKTFYRAFEAMRDAVTTVSYPAVARLHTQERFAELRTSIEKMMSFVLIMMIPVVLFCELGGSNFIFHLFFGAKYNDSIAIFNVLALFGILLPFTLNFNVLTGLGESRAILRIVIISSLVSVASNFILVPQFHAIGAAFTLILASVVSGVLATLAVKKSVPFEWSALFRGIDDGMRFLKRQLRRS